MAQRFHPRAADAAGTRHMTTDLLIQKVKGDKTLLMAGNRGVTEDEDKNDRCRKPGPISSWLVRIGSTRRSISLVSLRGAVESG